MTDERETPPSDALFEKEQLKAKLVMETARLPWTELQRFYARGQVVRVAADLDLIEAAMAVAEDDKDQVKPWLDKGLFGDVAPAQAQDWYDRGASLWTVVVAPWVLVQEDRPQAAQGASESALH